MKHKVWPREPCCTGLSCWLSALLTKCLCGTVQYKLAPERLTRLGNSNVLRLPVINLTIFIYQRIYISIHKGMVVEKCPEGGGDRTQYKLLTISAKLSLIFHPKYHLYFHSKHLFSLVQWAKCASYVYFFWPLKNMENFSHYGLWRKEKNCFSLWLKFSYTIFIRFM